MHCLLFQAGCCSPSHRGSIGEQNPFCLTPANNWSHPNVPCRGEADAGISHSVKSITHKTVALPSHCPVRRQLLKQT